MSTPSPSVTGRRPLRDLPLFWKLLVPFLALMVVVGLAGTLLTVRSLSDRAETTLDQDLLRASVETRSLLHDHELYVLESANFAANVQGMPEAITKRDAGGAGGLLQSVLALKKNLNLLVAADASGNGVVEFVRDAPGGQPAPRAPGPWSTTTFVAEALASQDGAPSSGLLSVDGRWLLGVAAPICSASTGCKPVGAAIGGVRLDRVAEDARVRLAPAEKRSGIGVAIYDEKGGRVSAAGPVSSQAAAPGAGEGIRRRREDAGGHEVAAAYAPFTLQGRDRGLVAVTLPVDPAYASVRDTGWRLVGIVLAAMVGIVAVGALLSRRILGQVRHLVETNRSLGAGDLGARAPVLSRDELGELASGVNSMAEQLQASYETLEMRVHERTEEVERLLEQRTEFFTAVSHDLRTPLAVIQAQARLLDDPSYRKGGGWSHEVAATLDEASDQILAFVNDMLEIARAEAGSLQLDMREVNLSEVVKGLRGTLEALARGGELRASTRLPDRLPAVQADPTRLREVILHLIDNAVKYTPPGGKVELSVETSNGHVVVSVSDTGPGIPVETGDRVFEPFFRVEGTRPQRGQASSGLGLALAKRLVEAHGGTISYESVPGDGTIFRFTLVAARSRRSGRTPATPALL
jgi:two-component system OmpR family sensor kinase